jgi:hypothetical protein
MLNDLRAFQTAIGPFRKLWSKLRITSVIVYRDKQWVSVATRIALAYGSRGEPVFLRPTKDFLAFSLDLPLSRLECVLGDILDKGMMRVNIGEKTFNIIFRLPDPSAPQTIGQQIYCGSVYSVRHHERHEFQIGECIIRMMNPSLDGLYKVFNQEQQAHISSRLRTQRRRFSDVADFFAQLGISFNWTQNYTMLEVVAPLPFSMHSTGTAVRVSGPPVALRKLRVTGFFDTGNAIFKLKGIGKEKGPYKSVAGPIPWPDKSTHGKFFLYFGKHEVGSVQIQRWGRSTNWQHAVHEFFDASHTLLNTGLQARKDSELFEMAVVRLLNELQVPAVWYGGKQYQDRPDLVACIQSEQEWQILLGECTGQKPVDKFTRLLTRQDELTKLLQGEVRILPVVFTPSTVSSTDKKQARQDGIIIVGANELAVLARGIGRGWNAMDVLGYLQGLFSLPLEFLSYPPL